MGDVELRPLLVDFMINYFRNFINFMILLEESKKHRVFIYL